MADYFSRIAQQALGRGQGVSPALAPLFAPGPTTPGAADLAGLAGLAGVEAVEAGDDGDIASLASAMLDVRRPRPERRWSPAPLAPTLTAAPDVTQPGSLDIRPIQTTAGADPAPSAPQSERVGEMQRQAAIAPVNAPPAFPEASGEDGRALPALTSRNQRPLFANQPDRAAIRAQVTVAPGETAVEHEGERSATHDTADATHITEVAPGAPSAPVIRVTIGRIEVRAIIQPASPSPRAASHAPAPSPAFEAYLRQRREGRP